MFEIRRPVLIRRRADGDKLKQSVIDALGDVGRKLESPGFTVSMQIVIQTRLIDRYFAGIEPLYPVFIDMPSRMKISAVPLTSLATKVSALESKTTQRPLAEMTGLRTSIAASVPPVLTLTRLSGN